MRFGTTFDTFSALVSFYLLNLSRILYKNELKLSFNSYYFPTHSVINCVVYALVSQILFTLAPTGHDRADWLLGAFVHTLRHDVLF